MSLNFNTYYNSSGTGKYRWGFNGQEKDDNLKGSGNSYTTEWRQYDPRLGKWLVIDPMAHKFPWQSPYTAFDNNPIYYIDPRGDQTAAPPVKDPIPGEIVGDASMLNGREYHDVTVGTAQQIMNQGKGGVIKLANKPNQLLLFILDYQGDIYGTAGIGRHVVLHGTYKTIETSGVAFNKDDRNSPVSFEFALKKSRELISDLKKDELEGEELGEQEDGRAEIHVFIKKEGSKVEKAAKELVKQLKIDNPKARVTLVKKDVKIKPEGEPVRSIAEGEIQVNVSVRREEFSEPK